MAVSIYPPLSAKAEWRATQVARKTSTEVAVEQNQHLTESCWSSPQAVEHPAVSDYFVYFLDARITTRSFPERFCFVFLFLRITSTSIFVLSNEGIYIIFVLLNFCTHTANTFKLHSSRNPVNPVTSITSKNSKSFKRPRCPCWNDCSSKTQANICTEHLQFL